MTISRWYGGILAILWSISAYALPIGSLQPLNACPLARHFCRATSAEQGIPQDYPTPALLGAFRMRCTISFMQKMARPGGIFNPALGPRVCNMAAAFVGATPGEWRALAITQMRGHALNQTAVGRQLLRQIKAGFQSLIAGSSGSVARPPRMRAPTPGGFSVSTRASALVARRVRAVRVAMERAAIERTGAPVRLAVGRCRATLVLSPRGRVEEMIGTRCSNAGIRRAFDRAVFNGQPLRVGGGGRSRRVHVAVIAALAEPGSEDGFTH
ncbi:MAG: hypothetical protein ACYCXG_09455 [Acidiferrobacter sp.]